MRAWRDTRRMRIHSGEYTQEYSDGPCKVEREWKRVEFKDKIECKAYAEGPRGKAQRRVVIAQPPWKV